MIMDGKWDVILGEGIDMLHHKDVLALKNFTILNVALSDKYNLYIFQRLFMLKYELLAQSLSAPSGLSAILWIFESSYFDLKLAKINFFFHSKV